MSPTRPAILFVIYGLAPAGPERRILDFARAFPERDDALDVHICVVGDDLTLLEEFQKTRAALVHVPIRRPYVEWRRVQRVVEYIGTHDIRVVNSFNLKTLLVCAAAKLRHGPRVKLVHHLISLWDDVSPAQQALTRAAMRAADAILCNGHAVRRHLIGDRRLTAPVSVIPNGVDCEHFRPMPELRACARARFGLTDDEFVVGAVANIRPVKNYPFLLRAMTRLSASVPGARLLCVGGGPQLEETKALARSLGLADRVIFTGVTTDVRPFLAAMDAFALCSLREGNPNVVLQAMAAAVPVVSVDVGEVPYVVEHGCSGYVVGHDEAAFAGALERLAGDARLRCAVGAAARRRVSESFSAPTMIAGYAALMHKVAAAGA